MLKLLKHDTARSLSHDKAVAVTVVGARGLLWSIVKACRKRAAGRKARKGKPVHGGLCSTCDHHVRVAERNNSAGIANRVRAGRTRSHNGMVRAFKIMDDRDLAAYQVNKPTRNKERRDASRSFFVQGYRGVIDTTKSANSRSNQYARLDLLLKDFRRPIRVSQSLSCSTHSVDDKVVDPPLFLRIHPVVGIERIGRMTAWNLRRDLAGKVRNVKILDPRGSRIARQEPTPCRLNSASHRSHHANTGDNDPFHRFRPSLQYSLIGIECSNPRPP